MEYIRVRNFEKFQHYKHRNPPWIRLYSNLLGDPDFYNLDGAVKFQIIGMFLLASKCDNKIRADAEWIRIQIQSVEPVYLETLLATGFIEERKQRASKALATSKQDATPETDNSETDIQSRVENIAAEDTRRAPFVAYCFETYRKPDRELIADASDFKAVKTLLKATAGKELFALEKLQEYWSNFLHSPDLFHQKQGKPLRFFCLNINAFVTGVKNGTQPRRESAAERAERINQQMRNGTV